MTWLLLLGWLGRMVRDLLALDALDRLVDSDGRQILRPASPCFPPQIP